MALTPLSAQGSARIGAAQVSETTAVSSSEAAPHAAEPALLVPLGSAQVPTTSRSSAPSVLAGLLRPAVLGVMLAVSLAAVEPALAQGAKQGAPLTPVAVAVQPAAKDAIEQAFTRILAADGNGDGIVYGGRWQNETAGLDPLASAVFAYVDQINPRGSYSLWGATSRGDYQVGGLGLGYTTRPAHMTANQLLTRADLEQGVRELKRALATPRADLVAQDLAAITQEWTDKTGAAPSADSIARAADGLLERIKREIESKERATGKEVVQLGADELLAKLDPGSLERTIAQVTAGHGKAFFARELETIDARRRAFGSTVPDEASTIGDAQQTYLLQITKAAKEESLLAQIRAHLR